MTLILRKSGKVGDRTRWNLSFSGISLSHKRGWITLNSRKRSTIDLPGSLFHFRVGPTGTLLWLIAFLAFDLAVLLGKALALAPVLVIDGTHEILSSDEDTVSSRGVGYLIAGLALTTFYVWCYWSLFGWALPWG